MTTELPYQNAGMDLLRQKPSVQERLQLVIQKSGRMGAVQAIRKQLQTPEQTGQGQWSEFAAAADKLLDHSAALLSSQHHLREAPNDANRAYQLTHYLIRCGQDETAAGILEKLLAQAPDNHKIRIRLAMAFTHLGRFDEAREQQELILRQNPNFAESWYQLASLGGVDVDDSAHFDGLLQAQKTYSGRNGPQEALIEFALGVVHHKARDYDTAFPHFSRANAIMARLHPYDAAFARKFFDHYRAAHTPEFLAAIAREGQSQTRRPIFIAGSARSGTTLLERLLTAHSGVTGGGELTSSKVAGYAMERMKPGEVRPAHLKEGAPSIWRRSGDFYDVLIGERFGSEGRVVDKAINLSLKMGFVLGCFAHAPVIWTRRNPCDVAWSAFQRRFNDQDWCWSLEGIANRLVEIERCEDHFSELAPDRILRIKYEELAHDPSPWIDRIFEHCGLEREPVETTFHEQGGAVATASAASVREPISTKSIGSWKRYEKHMAPFIDAYKKAGGREDF